MKKPSGYEEDGVPTGTGKYCRDCYTKAQYEPNDPGKVDKKGIKQYKSEGYLFFVKTEIGSEFYLCQSHYNHHEKYIDPKKISVEKVPIVTEHDKKVADERRERMAKMRKDGKIKGF